jgi:hypothetical protein
MVSRAAQFYCQKDFSSAPFKHQKYQSSWNVPAIFWRQRNV